MRFAAFSVGFMLAVVMVACSKGGSYLKTSNDNDGAQPSSPVAAATPPEVITFSKTFEGSIDNRYPIRMTLERKGSELSGTYQYTKHNVDIPLRGTVDPQDSLVLNEFDSKGNQTGIFKGSFTANYEINGTWSKPNGDNGMSFSLKENNPLAANKSATPAPEKEDFSETHDDTAPSNSAEGDTGTLVNEANTEAAQWLNIRSRRCGQYYRLKISESRAIWFPQIVRAPSVTVAGKYIPPRSLSEADRLNGVDPQPIEWQGTIVLSFGPWRSRGMQLSQMVWGSWSDSYQGHFPIFKQKDQWHISRSGVEILPFKCTDIPEDWR